MERGPNKERMSDRTKHSNEHKGDTGRFGNIFKTEVPRWKLEDGDHEFCIFPYQYKGTENSLFRTENPDFNLAFEKEELDSHEAWDYKLTVLVHNNIGVNQDAVVCLRTIKKKCPICELRSLIYAKMEKERDKDKAEDLDKQAWALSSSKRAIYNILVFDSEKEMEKGIQVWEAPHASIEDIVSEKHTDRRTGAARYYTNPEENWNVFFTRGKERGDRFPKYKSVDIYERKAQHKLTDKEIEELYDMTIDLESAIDLKEYDELKKMLGEGLAIEEDAAEERAGIDESRKGESRFSRGQKTDDTEEAKESRFRGGRKEETKEEAKVSPSAEVREAIKEEVKEETPFEQDDKEEILTPSKDLELAEKEDVKETLAPGNDPEPAENNIPSDYKDCFSKDMNKIDSCETCPEDVFTACYQAVEKVKKEKKKSPRTPKA